MGPPTLFTIPVLRYMKNYALTHEQLAMVSVVQRQWAGRNPRATLGRHCMQRCHCIPQTLYALDERTMTTLTIRNVEAAIKERLRVRAARNGRSMEAELRQILSDTLAPESSREPNLAEAIRRRFAPLGGIDLEPHPRVPVGQPPEFDE